MSASTYVNTLKGLQRSTKVRSSGGLWFAEVVATFGLLLVVFGVRSGRASAAPFAVGAYIGGAYFFTASTSFANPAVTGARMLSNTFAGITPSSVPPFVVARLVGAGLAVLAIRVLYPSVSKYAADVVLPREPRSAFPVPGSSTRPAVRPPLRPGAAPGARSSPRGHREGSPLRSCSSLRAQRRTLPDGGCPARSPRPGTDPCSVGRLGPGRAHQPRGRRCDGGGRPRPVHGSMSCAIQPYRLHCAAGRSWRCRKRSHPSPVGKQ